MHFHGRLSRMTDAPGQNAVVRCVNQGDTSRMESCPIDGAREVPRVELQLRTFRFEFDWRTELKLCARPGRGLSPDLHRTQSGLSPDLAKTHWPSPKYSAQVI